MFSDFSGLPVINNDETVSFRASMKDGVQGIFKSTDDSCEVIADTNGEFADLGRFTDLNDIGKVVFNAVKKNGSSCICTLFNGELDTIAETSDGFDSFRIAVINNSGNIIFYGVTKEGREGIFRGNDPSGDMIISINDNLFDSTVKEIAFNPVSLNDNSQIALRIKLENKHQMIVRADLLC